MPQPKLSAEEQDILEANLAKTEGEFGPLWKESVLQGLVDPPNIRAARRARKAFITQDEETLAMIERAVKLSEEEDPVLILGESGTGKELLANIVHGSRKGPFVAVNVCAITDTLFESELFGHVRGSFTGADKDRDGLIKQAEGGTLFLDEIGDMSLSIQTKLLRMIQAKKYRKVGANVELDVKCRIVTATHQNIPKMVRDKTFRIDLFERLQVFKLRIKPLRERPQDILLHVKPEMIADIYAKLGASTNLVFSGNVRQLLNVKRRWEVFGKEDIEPEDVL